jgi:hypothetical protein
VVRDLFIMLPLLGMAAESSVRTALQGEPCPDGTRPAVQGLVLDEATRVPLTGAEVTLSFRAHGERRDRSENVRSTAGGGFRFCGVPAGVTVQLQARYGYGSAQPVHAVTGGEAEVRLVVPTSHSILVGRVQDASGSPVDAAAVRLAGTPLATLTGRDGRFRFPRVPPGDYEIDVAMLGYRTVRDSVAVEPAATVDVAVRLVAEAVRLEPLTVTTRSFRLERAGFYQRQERSAGAFITRERIARQNPYLTSDVLRGVAGVRLEQGRGHGAVPTGRGNCPFRYIVDGTRIGPGFEIDDLRADWIEAIEVYRGPSEVPAEFSVGPSSYRANCGLIVVWTRDR